MKLFLLSLVFLTGCGAVFSAEDVDCEKFQAELAEETKVIIVPLVAGGAIENSIPDLHSKEELLIRMSESLGYCADYYFKKSPKGKVEADNIYRLNVLRPALNRVIKSLHSIEALRSRGAESSEVNAEVRVFKFMAEFLMKKQSDLYHGGSERSGVGPDQQLH